MKKLPALLVLLAAFAIRTAYGDIGMGKVVIYKGVVKAAKTSFDVNDTNNLLSTTMYGYWAINVVPESGMMISSFALIYNPKARWLKTLSDIPGLIELEPYDPCRVVMLNFSAEDPEGSFSFYATGKGKLMKFSDDPAAEKGYIVPVLKGTGTIINYDFLDTADTRSGAVTVLLKMDARRTRRVNANIDGYGNINDIMNEIFMDLTSSGGWSQWMHIPPP